MPGVHKLFWKMKKHKTGCSFNCGKRVRQQLIKNDGTLSTSNFPLLLLTLEEVIQIVPQSLVTKIIEMELCMFPCNPDWIK